jgi:SAM-dependent methyltransferase
MLYEPEAYWGSVARAVATDGEWKEQVFKWGMVGPPDAIYRYGRERLEKEFEALKPAGRVLEVGCGLGGNLVALGRHGVELAGVDISADMIALAEENTRRHGMVASLHKIDGSRINFPDESFDLVLTVTVLQHVTSRDAVAQLADEMVRVTHSGGRLVIMEATLAPWEREPADVFHSVPRRKDEYVRLFRDRGLNLTQYHSFRSPLLEIAHAAWRLWKKRPTSTESNRPIPPPDTQQTSWPRDAGRVVKAKEYLIACSRVLDPVLKIPGGLGIYQFRKTAPSTRQG